MIMVKIYLDENCDAIRNAPKTIAHALEEAKNVSLSAYDNSSAGGWHKLDGYLDGRSLGLRIFAGVDERDFNNEIDLAERQTVNYEQEDVKSEITRMMREFKSIERSLVNARASAKQLKLENNRLRKSISSMEMKEQGK